MNEISHDQARRYILASIDGFLDAREEQMLQEHLHTCESCRKEADQLDKLGRNLEHTFHDHLGFNPLTYKPGGCHNNFSRPLDAAPGTHDHQPASSCLMGLALSSRVRLFTSYFLACGIQD